MQRRATGRVGFSLRILALGFALSLALASVAHAAFFKLSGTMPPTGDVTFVDTSPDGVYAIYQAAQDVVDARDLYSVPLAGGAPVRLSSLTLASTSTSVSGMPLITPDSSRVIFGADQEVDNLYELYSVPIGGPSTAAVKLHPPLAPTADIVSFALTPDGSRVIFLADLEVDDLLELYSIPVAGPGSAAQKLSIPIASPNDVSGFEISPDGSRVVYRVSASGVIELYSVPIDGPPGAAVKIKEQLGGNVFSNFNFQISPDGQHVVYQDDQDVEGTFEMYSVPIGGPLAATAKLNGPLAASGDVALFLGSIAFSPDGQRVAYVADQETDGVDELYSVPIGGPASAGVKLNKPLVAGGDVAFFSGMVFDFTADSSRVVYAADQDTDGVIELYSAPAAGPASAGVKLNQAFVAGGGLSRFELTPDGARVIYQADQETDTVNELYSVPIGGPATAGVKLNKPLVAGGTTSSFRIADDGSRVAYSADQDTDNLEELYSVPSAGPASAGVGISGPLQPSGSINNIIMPPDSGRVLYTADQQTDGVFELYIADSGPPVAGFTQPAASVAETGGTIQLAVELNQTAIQPVNIQFRASGGTATNGADYTLAAGTLSFVPGQKTALITVPLISDTISEGAETIVVVLESPSNATLGQALITVTIRDSQIALPLVVR
jgi:Tol biopolymer transport system component